MQALLGWKIYHFHDTSASARVKKTCDLHDNRYLRGDASNLAGFLYYLKQTHERHYNRIVITVRQVAPFFGDFLLRPFPENEGKIRLEWWQKDSDYPFLADQLSDGTLRFICLATVLLQPELPSTILIDEPELGLHPYALGVLAGLLKSAARQSQVIVSTQSVTLMEQFDLEDLLVVELNGAATTIERRSVERFVEWLDEYSLGELWEKNVLGGRP
jgi:predicted ATPase